MKASQTRSLAYTLAKTISLEEQKVISGGAKDGCTLCHRETIKASGSGINNVDVVADFGIDF